MAEMKWRQAIDVVLTRASEPLSTKEITKRIIEENLRKKSWSHPLSHGRGTDLCVDETRG